MTGLLLSKIDIKQNFLLVLAAQARAFPISYFLFLICSFLIFCKIRIRIADKMIKWFMRMLIFTLGIFVGVEVAARMALRFKPAPAVQPIVPKPGQRLRMKYRDPVKALDFVNLHRNETVLELGAGKGLFTLEAARRVGAGGTVHAVDMRPRVIERLADKLDEAQISNVRLHLADASRLPVPANSVDAVFMVSTLPIISNRRASLEEIKRVLKPGGELVIGEEMPEPEYIRPGSLRKWAEQAGFRLVARNGTPFAYLLKFVKPLAVLDEAEQIAQSAA